MNDINSISLTGRITKDANLAYTTGGTCYAKFTLANNEYRKGNEKKTNFFDCVVWGKYGVGVAPLLVKGVMVALIGRMSQVKWTTNEGENRTSWSVTVENMSISGLIKEEQPFDQPQGKGQYKQAVEYQGEFRDDPEDVIPV